LCFWQEEEEEEEMRGGVGYNSFKFVDEI